MRERILGAKERSFALEYTIFEEIRKQTAKHIQQIESTARAVAMLDTLASLHRQPMTTTIVSLI